MNTSLRIVISASRRTDIPAFYMPWFMAQIEKGVLSSINPFNRRVKAIPIDRQIVHCIVFWSKNFGPFIQNGFGRQLQRSGYRLFFNFTLNSALPLLEPNVPALNDRLRQLKQLCDHHGSEAVTWRFDPICFFETAEGEGNNLADFKRIAQAAARIGILRCTTSFCDDYPKIRKRVARLSHFRFIDPPMKKKVAVLTRMADYLKDLGMTLFTCCEKGVRDHCRDVAFPAACIDHRLLMRLFGEGLSQQRDTGQRVKKGCGCHQAVDIGDYRQHPCYHDCLFCYANPVPMPKKDTAQERIASVRNS